MVVQKHHLLLFMNNPRLLKIEIDAKFKEIEQMDKMESKRDAFENPTKALVYYKEELKFWNDRKLLLAQMNPKSFICEEEHAVHEDLKKCFLKIYPSLEMKYLQIISILEGKLNG